MNRLLPYFLAAPAALFLAALYSYPGSKAAYLVFSVSFLALMASAAWRPASYGYFFLSLFMWLGFWLKASVHFIFTYPYLEPIGRFEPSAAGWDLVMYLSSAAAAALLLSRLFSSAVRMPGGINASAVYADGAGSRIPGALRPWVAIFLCALAVAVFNSWAGIHQVGLLPRTILPWPGNALIAWLMNAGLSLAIAVLAYRDISAGRSLLPAVVVISSAAFMLSISMFSRGPFIYQALPLLLGTAYLRRDNLSPSSPRFAAAAGLFLLLFALSVFSVNSLRTRTYSGVMGKEAAAAAAAPVAADRPAGVLDRLRQNRHLRQISGLFIDRWIGLEGVMAVSAYPEKRPGLLLEALSARRTENTIARYEDICGSDFQKLDEKKHQFGRIPGPAALFYYSGSLWIVFLGMFVLGAAVMAFESAAWLLTRNPLVCALMGMMAANNAAQLGEAPAQMMPTYIATVGALMLIWVYRFRAERSGNG